MTYRPTDLQTYRPTDLQTYSKRNKYLALSAGLLLSLNVMGQTPIIGSSTSSAPTGFSEIITSNIFQQGPRIGIGLNNPSSLLTLSKKVATGSQGDTYSGQSAAIRFETRNLVNQWRYWDIQAGERFSVRNLTDPNLPITPLNIALNGQVDFMDKVFLSAQGVAGNNNNKLGLVVNTDKRQILWSSFTFNTGGDNANIPLEFNYDANSPGASDNNVMTLMPNGQVRIGPKNTLYENYTTNSTANNNQSMRLTVKGGVLATRFIATTQNWADWVFYSHSKNPSLEDEKENIEKYCTLIGVPSENEVKNGMDLAETDAILLSKIEQNYLHDIQQQELINKLLLKIDNLEKEILRLNAKISDLK